MTTSSEHLVNRIRQEYLEMPGLALTVRQASRLWNLDVMTCEGLLQRLLRERFLTETPAGGYVRLTADTICQARMMPPLYESDPDGAGRVSVQGRGHAVHVDRLTS